MECQPNLSACRRHTPQRTRVSHVAATHIHPFLACANTLCGLSRFSSPRTLGARLIPQLLVAVRVSTVSERSRATAATKTRELCCNGRAPWIQMAAFSRRRRTRAAKKRRWRGSGFPCSTPGRELNRLSRNRERDRARRWSHARDVACEEKWAPLFSVG